MGIMDLYQTKMNSKKIVTEGGNVLYETSDGVIIDEQGRFKDDYEDMSIPVTELRKPLNEAETKRCLKRYLSDPKLDRIKKLAMPRKDDK